MSRSSALAYVLAGALAVSACQRGTGGPFAPVAEQGVEEETGNVARLTRGALTVQVAGQWATDRGQWMRLAYRNAGSTPLQVAVTDLKLSYPAGSSTLRTVVDNTGVNLEDARADNDEASILYSRTDRTTGPRTLTVPPGATRELNANFGILEDTTKPAAGERITATVPMAGTNATVTFTAADPPSKPF